MYFSKTPNNILMLQAKQAFTNKIGIAILAVLTVAIINGILSRIPFIGGILILALSGAFMVGLSKFYLNIIRNKDVQITEIFSGFEGANFITNVIAGVLVFIFTLLWSLLFIIPGIIKYYSYSMTTYILAEDKSILATQAIDKSKQMMEGNKMKLFILDCCFAGWFLLGIVTAGLGFIYVLPYFITARAKFYEDLKQNPAIISY